MVISITIMSSLVSEGVFCPILLELVGLIVVEKSLDEAFFQKCKDPCVMH